MTEGSFPKADGDVLYASEINDLQRTNSLLESMYQTTKICSLGSYTDQSYTYGQSDTMSDSSGYNNTVDTGAGTTGTFGTGATCYTSTSTTSANEESLGEVTSRSETFEIVKTLTFPTMKKVTTVANEIAGNASGDTVTCYMKFTYSDSTTGNSEENSTNNSGYQSKSYTNPSQGKPVNKIEVYLKTNVNQPEPRHVHERNTIATAFTYTSGVVKTNVKAFSSNAKSIMVYAKKTLNGNSTITYDVSSDGGSVYEKTAQTFGSWVALDGDNNDIMLKFNLNVDSGNTPEFYGYSYLVLV